MKKNKFVYINQSNNQTNGGIKMNKSFNKLFTTVSALAIMGTVFVGAQSTFAATTAGDTTTTAGSLTVTAPNAFSFGSFGLTGERIVKTATLTDLVVNDARGSGLGWNLKVSASALANGLKELSPGSLELTAAPSISTVAGGDLLGVTAAAGILDNGGFIIANATADKGMGKFTFTFGENSLKLTMNPKETYAGTYTTTVTWDLLSGPTR